MLARHGIGGNNPPSPIEIGQQTCADLSTWLAETPVIESEGVARDGAKLVTRAKAALEEIEKERDSKVRPLNEQVKGINLEYKTAVAPLDAALRLLRGRLTDFAEAEEARRYQEAKAKREAAELAEKIARDAEARELAALENAAAGELGVNVVELTVDADKKFSDFGKASREATIAERDAQVRLKGTYGRALTLRTSETLILDDAVKAIQSIGNISDKTREAILSDARAYRKLNGKLPEGVTSQTSRSI